MSQIITPHFMSRDTDSITVKVGGRDPRSFRAILLADESGDPLHEICLVDMPMNGAPHANEDRIAKVMQLMEDGLQYRKLTGKQESLVPPIQGQQKARIGDFIRNDGRESKVISINTDGNETAYELENGRIIGESEFTIDDVLLESEVY